MRLPALLLWGLLILCGALCFSCSRGLEYLGDFGRDDLPLESGPPARVSMAAFEEGRLYLYRSGRNGTGSDVSVYTLPEGQELGSLPADGIILGISKSPEGRLALLHWREEEGGWDLILSLYTGEGTPLESRVLPPSLLSFEDASAALSAFLLTETGDLLLLYGTSALEPGGLLRYSLFSGTAEPGPEEWNKEEYRPFLPVSRGGSYAFRSIVPGKEGYYIAVDMESDPFDGILVLDKDLRFIRYITGEWFFNNPSDLRIDGRGYLYIANRWTHNIKVFRGNRMITSSLRDGMGGEEGPLMREPVALDRLGDSLYVYDRISGRILRFSTLRKGRSRIKAYYEQIPQSIVPKYSTGDSPGGWFIPFILGLLFAVSLHSLLTARIVGDRSYFYFALVNLAGIPFFIERSYRRFFFSLPADTPSLFSWLLLLLFICFSWEFLRIGREAVFYRKAYLFLAILASCFFFLTALCFAVLPAMSEAFVLISDIGMLASILILLALPLSLALTVGHREARVFLVLTPLFAFSGLFSIGLLNERLWKDSTFYQFVGLGYPLMLGFSLQSLILSFSLGVRYNHLRRERERTSTELLLLKESERQKTEFVMNLSHELRTPLTVIDGISRQLVSGAFGDSIQGNRPRFEMINRNSRRLLKQINNLLDLSRLGRKAYVPIRKPVRLDSYLLLLAAEFSSKAELKGLTLDCREVTEALWILGDPYLLDTVFLNLIANALKFTRSGGQVLLSAKTDGETVLVGIEDTGPGIPKGEQERIFDPFYQGRARSEGQGAGLGLHLVREAIRSLGGTISVKSEQGQGALFQLRLPSIIPPDGSDEIDASGPDQERSGQYGAELESSADISDPPEERTEEREIITVLLVEDDEDLSRYIRSELGTFYRILRARSGSEALEVLESVYPDLIISDVMMPGMTGHELFEALRGDPVYRNLPFLFLTARADREERLDALSRGATEYMEKPFSSRELKARVDTIVIRDRRIREQQRHSIKDSIVQLLDRWNEGGPEDVLAIAPSPERLFMERGLTEREIAVARLILSGLSDKEIASRLGISPSTVANHNQKIFRKMAVSGRVELISLSRRA